MFSKKVLLSFLLVFLMAPFFFAQDTVSAAKFFFLRNLRVGDSGKDVFELQKILNADPLTQVAPLGIGSPGNETAFFGNLTKNAVIKYQNFHVSSILDPAGISSGNGYVGQLTRNTLNNSTLLTQSQDASLATVDTINNVDTYTVRPEEKIDIYQKDKQYEDIQAQIVAKINNAIKNRLPAGDLQLDEIKSINNNVAITELSVNIGRVGDVVTINGLGFTSINNNVYIGNTYIIRNLPVQAGTISFKVPPIPSGRYDIVIKNNNGISNSTFFIISSVAMIPVTIQSVTPERVAYGQNITITGSGFTPENNEVFTTFGKIKGVVSVDGKTLSVIIAPESMKEIASYGKSNKELKFKIEIGVINGNGYTVTPSVITFTY